MDENKSSPLWKGLGWILLLVLAGLFLTRNSDRKTNTSPASTKSTEDQAITSARGACLITLRKALHDPKSAEIDPARSWKIERTDIDSFRVIITGRAKNGFGALRHGQWVCDTKISKTGVRVVRLDQI